MENDVVVASDGGLYDCRPHYRGKSASVPGLITKPAPPTPWSSAPPIRLNLRFLVIKQTQNTERFTINLRDVNEHNPVFDTKADDPDLVANGRHGGTC